MKAYPTADCLWFYSSLQQFDIISAYALQFTILTAARTSEVRIVRAKALNYEPIPGLNSVRDFVFQREIKDKMLREIELTKTFQITNLCSDNGTIIKDLGKTVFTPYGADYRKIENFYSCTDPAGFLV